MGHVEWRLEVLRVVAVIEGGGLVSECSALPALPCRRRVLFRALRFLASALGRAWRYFCVVEIWAWPMRSMTDLRSASPARSQEAWAWRRSWTRTSTPEALVAGNQTR